MNIFSIITLFLILFFSTSYYTDSIFIRINQVGFNLNDIKTGVVLSNSNIAGKQIEIIDLRTNKIAVSVPIKQSKGEYASFGYSYQFDFSKVIKEGSYLARIGSKKSFSFEIGNNLYPKVVRELMKFFPVQRCGYTDPKMHDVCHIADATRLIDGKGQIFNKIDVTGGWHDAGDYVKFLSTTAYTTYTLLFSYQYDQQCFGFDYNLNGTPDILEEAKIGLDWLLRANYDDDQLVVQVQDLQDHAVGWRMPEEDELQYNRPAFVGTAKNLIGLYSATLALGAKLWAEKFEYYEFADKCIFAAEKLYKSYKYAPDVDSSGTGVYLDKSYEGKMALGAIELYELTKNKKYLKDAIRFGNKAGSDYWWSWGDINSFAHFKISKYSPKFVDYIESNLKHFSATMEENLFGDAAEHNWGSNNTMMGMALQAILWKKRTGKSTYDQLVLNQRDYILGKNPWGLSFIYKIGKFHAKNFHHQIAHFSNGRLPGGFAAGPVQKKIIDESEIKFEKPDRFTKFQTDKAYYRDDRMDWISNEPTISANATAIFVMGNQ